MKFTKMEGCGNDYIYVNCFQETVENPGALAVRLSDRHFGIGGDGMILIEPSDRADAYMHMFNLDGSEGSMCGNGIRCVAKYIYDHGIIPPERRTAVIDTPAGLRQVELTVENGAVSAVTVDMGQPVVTGEIYDEISVRGIDVKYIGVSTGNPHAVVFLDENPELKDWVDEECRDSILANLPLSDVGPEFEHNRNFPDGVNTEFINVLAPDEIDFRVWERGSGETLACGTGATASVFAGIMAGKLNNQVTVHLVGGDLIIKYDTESGSCMMTGPAVEVFSGTVVE